MKYSADQIGMHVFEVSGCGVAPFHFAGYFKYEPKDGEYEEVNVGFCNHCGKAIVHHYVVSDADGGLFAVGSECIAKSGDAGLIRALDVEKKRQSNLKKEEKAETKRQMKAEKTRQLVQANIDKFSSEYPECYQFLVAECEKENCQPIFQSFMYQIKKWGNLTDNQINVIEKAIVKAIVKASEPVLVSKHVGVLGMRQTFSEVKIERILTIPCQSFGYNDRSSIDLYIMKDKDGNSLFYKSKTIAKYKNGHQVESGDVVELTASVKEHGYYKESAQTIIQRPTWNKVD